MENAYFETHYKEGIKITPILLVMAIISLIACVITRIVNPMPVGNVIDDKFLAAVQSGAYLNMLEFGAIASLLVLIVALIICISMKRVERPDLTYSFRVIVMLIASLVFLFLVVARPLQFYVNEPTVAKYKIEAKTTMEVLDTGSFISSYVTTPTNHRVKKNYGDLFSTVRYFKFNGRWCPANDQDFYNCSEGDYFYVISFGSNFYQSYPVSDYSI